MLVSARIKTAAEFELNVFLAISNQKELVGKDDIYFF